MLYCPANVTFLRPWVDHGLSHCFADTVSASFVVLFIYIFGGVQIRMYRKYSSDLDVRLFPKSNLYKIQIAFHVILPLTSLVRLILEMVFLYNKAIYGYMILSACCYCGAFPIALYLLYLERHKALPSVPSSGHGLVLLVFWTAVFIVENLTLLNLQNEKWWFDLQK